MSRSASHRSHFVAHKFSANAHTSQSAPPSPPDKNAILRVAAAALQSRSVTVERLDRYVYRTYRLRTSSGFFYLLRCCPGPDVRLLRHEQGWFQAEAAALHALGGRKDAVAPRLIECQPRPHAPLSTPHLISGPFAGHILADIEPNLDRAALASIDASLGAHVRQLASLTGRHFGYVQAEGLPSSGGGGGGPRFDTWTQTFAFLLQTLLRDAEDVQISLPYDTIRDLVRRHRAALDRIITPRLMLIELASDSNVIVDAAHPRVSGLLDFSTALWGDPFMSDCFYSPTASFAQGFGRLPNASADERARQYLYVLYHSLLAIVRKVYRASRNESAERDARRNLTTAIRQLDAMTSYG